MKARVYGWYSFVANSAVIALLFVGYLLCTVGFSVRGHFLGLANEVPDTQQWYSREELRSLLEHFGPDRRPIYALTECSLDLVFPLIYASLFAGLIAHVYPRRGARWLLSLPLAAMMSGSPREMRLDGPSRGFPPASPNCFTALWLLTFARRFPEQFVGFATDLGEANGNALPGCKADCTGRSHFLGLVLLQGWGQQILTLDQGLVIALQSPHRR